MDARTGPVLVEVNGTAAQLLIKLMGDLDTADPMAVLTRALGVLDTALASKRAGKRLGVYDPRSESFSDLVI